MQAEVAWRNRKVIFLIQERNGQKDLLMRTLD